MLSTLLGPIQFSDDDGDDDDYDDNLEEETSVYRSDGTAANRDYPYVLWWQIHVDGRPNTPPRGMGRLVCSTASGDMPPPTTTSRAISSHAVACPVTACHASTTTPTVQPTFLDGCSAACAMEVIPTTSPLSMSFPPPPLPNRSAPPPPPPPPHHLRRWLEGLCLRFPCPFHLPHNFHQIMSID
ncbi:hypothetical protein GW17_00026988 [Ensete ventricosum]|nr:hypothetical protein GW17_00026988 [Ensete ventricosum]